jgi:23S rRNA (uracil1939-C5)-methyltransferase
MAELSTGRYLIESLDLDANGVSRADGKVAFVRGALPGEQVVARIVRRKPRFDVAEVVSVERESPLRATPRCPHFGTCGGCSMQHVEPRAQVSIKQRALEDALWHIGRVRAETLLPPIVGPAFGYRFRARLSVRHVPKKGGVLVGFHERGSSYVADMRECHVLSPEVSALLLPLRELVAGLSIRDRMPQVEVAQGETVLALVFRILEPLTVDDEAALRAFGDRHRLEVWLQPKGPDSITLLQSPAGAGSALHYTLPEFGVAMPFRPTDFTQVNHVINASLVGRAIRLLDPQPTDRVADLFCGLGNFTLPLATRSASVVGIEGSAALVGRAQDNAAANGLSERCAFRTANLFELDGADWRALGPFDRVLVDPPREGALAVAQALSAPDTPRPARVVYVSCNPATLARDAAVLVHEGGWTLRQAGAINMFPHTSHVESMAVFEP